MITQGEDRPCRNRFARLFTLRRFFPQLLNVRDKRDSARGRTNDSIAKQRSAKKNNGPLELELEEASSSQRRFRKSSSRKVKMTTPSCSTPLVVHTAGECPICINRLPAQTISNHFDCTHRVCDDCLRMYLCVEISESRVNISCPACEIPIHPNIIYDALRVSPFLRKYEQFMIRRVMSAEPDIRWCPGLDCDYAVIAHGCASCPLLQCEREECLTQFCYHCKQQWHPNITCETARRETRRRKLERRKRRQQHTNNAEKSEEEALSSTASDTCFSEILPDNDHMKPCPCCRVLILKMDDGSCNHMTCSVCGTEFCWLCSKKISDLHYLSPSGCTFWGKKPWSRKKKIFWQLGMLVGAPVGIALIAGIAVPTIIIGVPVWIGRKLRTRLLTRSMGKRKRNLLITSGVVSSIAISPIVAAITVGIGVPILLAYVYGVVPITLCRTGGCGISTGVNGVKIEMDEESPLPKNRSLFITEANVLSSNGDKPAVAQSSFIIEPTTSNSVMEKDIKIEED